MKGGSASSTLYNGKGVLLLLKEKYQRQHGYMFWFVERNSDKKKKSIITLHILTVTQRGVRVMGYLAYLTSLNACIETIVDKASYLLSLKS